MAAGPRLASPHLLEMFIGYYINYIRDVILLLPKRTRYGRSQANLGVWRLTMASRRICIFLRRWVQAATRSCIVERFAAGIPGPVDSTCTNPRFCRRHSEHDAQKVACHAFSFMLTIAKDKVLAKVAGAENVLSHDAFSILYSKDRLPFFSNVTYEDPVFKYFSTPCGSAMFYFRQCKDMVFSEATELRNDFVEHIFIDCDLSSLEFAVRLTSEASAVASHLRSLLIFYNASRGRFRWNQPVEADKEDFYDQPTNYKSVLPLFESEEVSGPELGEALAQYADPNVPIAFCLYGTVQPNFLVGDRNRRSTLYVSAVKRFALLYERKLTTTDVYHPSHFFYGINPFTSVHENAQAL